MKKRCVFYGLLMAGSCAAVSWMRWRDETKRLNRLNSALQTVRERLVTKGLIAGSWIEEEAVWIVHEGSQREVHFGGVNVQINQTIQQFECIIDTKTGAVLDLYAV